MSTAVEDGNDDGVDEVGAVGEPAQRGPQLEGEKGADQTAVVVQRDEGDPTQAERPDYARAGRVGSCHLHARYVTLVGGQHGQNDAHCGEHCEGPTGRQEGFAHLDALSFFTARQHVVSKEKAYDVRANATVRLDVHVLVI